MSVPAVLPLADDAVFGILLSAWAASRFLRFTEPGGAGRRADVRESARHCSRLVYLTLYAAMLVRLSCCMFSISWAGGALTFGWSPRFESSPQAWVMQSGEAFRGRLLGGLIALLLVRALAWRQCRQPGRPADRQVS